MRTSEFQDTLVSDLNTAQFKKCDKVVILNFQGDTALHVMARHERLDCVLALISYEADINIKVRGHS